ncbi:high affinity copper uptake protein 1 [Biomphalaria pfeifferi]|uniref:Copper transport protein n=1 Tax=Biomphalaria pfeifferi TaxID=112525 RepID=A0AAD8C4X0_BIOPF|nr:high affinity copper uptake protein 1 [Biomphalaria pfeifferi]
MFNNAKQICLSTETRTSLDLYRSVVSFKQNVYEIVMMMSYYHVGYKEFILFYELRTLSAGAMVGACFIIFAVAILYEGIKFLRDYLQQRFDPDRHVGVINSNYDNPFVGSSSDKLSKRAQRISAKRAILSGSHFLQTILHVLQVFISYCLMLIVMTFNIWLIIAVIAGAGVGYFLFGWMKHSTPEDEHNH